MKIDLVPTPLAGPEPARAFPVERLYNLGSATRDAASAVPHQEEVALAGVHIALDVPAPRIYPIARHALRTDEVVFTQCARTSGEVEIVLIQADRLYVGVGSDHTDREIEQVTIPGSKQACANVLAPTIWPFDEIRDHWDDCVLRSWVDGRLYQEVGVATFLHPDDVLRIVSGRVTRLPARDFVVFCGTFVSVDKALGYGARWSFEMEDPTAGRRIAHAYDVVNLFDEIAEPYRVPLFNPPRRTAAG